MLIINWDIFTKMEWLSNLLCRIFEIEIVCNATCEILLGCRCYITEKGNS